MPQRIPRSVATLLLAPLLLAGCGGDEELSAPDSSLLAGDYALARVNSARLPYLFAEVSGQRIEIIGGQLVLRPDLTFTYSIDTRITSGGESEVNTEGMSGKYVQVDRTTVQFQTEELDVLEGQLRGGSIVVNLGGMRAEFDPVS